MKHSSRLVAVLLVFVAASLSAQANERILRSYQDRLRDATPPTALALLETADMLTVEELGPLYDQAVRYVVSRSDRLSFDATLQSIGLLAAERIAEGGYRPGASSLWTLFVEWDDPVARTAILDALAVIGTGNADLVTDLNQWVRTQVTLHRSGLSAEQVVLHRAIVALAGFADRSSFPALVDVASSGISALTTAEARRAMRALPGDYAENAVRSVNSRALADRQVALELFVTDASLSDTERAAVAAGVLAQAVGEIVRDLGQQEIQRNLRYRAAAVLMEVPFWPATGSLVRHFDLTFADYDRGITARNWVLEAIAALGSTGTEQAAVRLTGFLDLLNTYTERDRPYDTQIMLAVVTNLGRLGHAVASRSLLDVTLLPYPQTVRAAAREALAAAVR